MPQPWIKFFEFEFYVQLLFCKNNRNWFKDIYSYVQNIADRVSKSNNLKVFFSILLTSSYIIGDKEYCFYDKPFIVK